MTSWPDFAALPRLDLEVVGVLAPLEVLYEFDGPCIFTASTAQHTLVLAYLSEELDDERLLRFIVATTSEATIAAMKEGSVSVREALDRGSLWLVDLDHAYRPTRAVGCRRSDLPEDALPAPTTMLWPALEPALVVRFEGAEIRCGSVPAVVFTQAAEISVKVLKPVFEWAAKGSRGEAPSRRPPEWFRQLYALAAQRVTFGSLEVGFRRADVSSASHQRDIQDRGWAALAEGLEWSASDEPMQIDESEEEKWLAVLEAMRNLAPAPAGPVDSVAVSGSLVGAPRRPFLLTRASAKRIRVAYAQLGLKKRHGVALRVFGGQVRGLDRDELTLILRDVPGESADLQLTLADEQLLEVALEALRQEFPVSVTARSEDRKVWTATEIVFTGGGASGRDEEE